MAVTRQVPALLAERVTPVTLQLAAVPFTAVKMTVPAPAPPIVDKVSGTPKVPDVATTLNAGCAALRNVTGVCTEVVEIKLASAALVAMTRHVPDSSTLNTSVLVR
jgi:hypothetical protein